MSLQFRTEFREKLVEKLKEILCRVNVTGNQFLEAAPFYELKVLENDLRKKKDFWDKCESYISDEPLVDFFYEVIDSELKVSNEYKTDSIVPLCTLDGYSDIEETAEKLVTRFEGLPFDYRIFLKLSFSLQENFESFEKNPRYELFDTCALTALSSDHKNSFPEPTVSNPRVSFNPFHHSPAEIKLNWNEHQTYFEFSTKGYIGLWAETTPLRDAHFTIRSFLGLAYALGILERRFALQSGEAYLLPYKHDGTKWEPQKPRQLPFETGRSMDSAWIATIGGSKFLGSEENQWFRRLDLIKGLFANRIENKNLIRAAQWFFDSFIGDDELLSFVKGTVCLEILLGDKGISDLIGLGELLRNRCAYLIAVNKLEREAIMKDFNEIYSTRSKIVHSGKNQLSSRERASLYKLRSLCKRVLSREIYLR